MSPGLDVAAVRARFPALTRTEGGRPVAYLDGPGGTQTPESVIEAMAQTLRRGVSNLGGGFAASDDAGAVTAAARSAVADLLSGDPGGVVFGQNMTSLTFAFSRAIAAGWEDGDAVVLTSLDHDANFTPWVLAARDRGVMVRVAEFDAETGLLPVEAVSDLLDRSVRLVAVCLASNALGTVVDVASIARAAHQVGALVYVDAVHAAPHVHIDVDTLDADYIAASAYKFFGPHIGAVHGRPDHLAAMEAFKVRPAPSDPPGKWETGTQSFESLAGATAAVAYLDSLGRGNGAGSIADALTAIRDHEEALGARFLEGIADMGHVRLYGPQTMDQRVPTFAVAVRRLQPGHVATRMARAGVYVWAGHYYAVNAMERLGVLDSGGLVRIGFVHYNTIEEVDRVLEALASMG